MSPRFLEFTERLPMKKTFLPLAFALFLFVSCGPTPEEQATMTATAQTATADAWTRTPTPTSTFTATPTRTLTPTITNTPTVTDTPTITFTPTYDFPDVVVSVNMASCRYGPSVTYLHQYDLYLGDTGVVWGRSPYNNWLYVHMDKIRGGCWLAPSVVTVTGDVSKMLAQQIRPQMTNDALYHSPSWVEATRNGDEVTLSWEEIWMTLDDDRGYFLDMWVCQGGFLVWLPIAMPDQYSTETTFVDETGCSEPSHGLLYTVEKHGYSNPVEIPWPPYEGED